MITFAPRTGPSRLMAVALFVGFSAAAVSAASVRLAWDASPTEGVTNYVLHAWTNNAENGPFAYTNAPVHVNVGTNLTASLEALQPGQWSFVVTAQKEGIESDPSNVVIVETPDPPARLRTIAIQYSGSLTNFVDVGFFRLRLP
jgi:hypothetical protein